MIKAHRVTEQVITIKADSAGSETRVMEIANGLENSGAIVMQERERECSILFPIGHQLITLMPPIGATWELWEGDR